MSSRWSLLILALASGLTACGKNHADALSESVALQGDGGWLPVSGTAGRGGGRTGGSSGSTASSSGSTGSSSSGTGGSSSGTSTGGAGTSSSSSGGTTASSSSSSGSSGTTGLLHLAMPAAAQLYHGVFTITGGASQVAPSDIDSYEAAAGKRLAFVYFSHEWSNTRLFPTETAKWIIARGALPVVRLMLRSSDAQNVAEPLYSLENIIAGKFDADLSAWGRAAAALGTPIVAEYGTEVNGDWFSWSGVFHGSANGGPATFKSAFRHIVQVVRAAGGTNVLWAFHVNWSDWPNETWNRFEQYYPGSDVVDWLGVSIYAAGSPIDGQWTDFTSAMDSTAARFKELAPDKPQFVLEFGAPANDTSGSQTAWVDSAFQNMLAGRWPNLKGFSWWNDHWRNDANAAHDTEMRVEVAPGLSAAFQRDLGPSGVLDQPLYR